RGVSRLDEASDAYVKALDTLKAFHREDTADYSDLLMNHAGLLRSTGKHARSAELFLDAVKLLEARQPRDDKALAGALANLSLSYQAAEDLKKAYKYEKKAYDLISGGAGGEIELAEALSRLAALKYRMTEYDAAEKFASEAIELFDKIKDQSPQRSAVYATLAAVKYHKDDYAASREAYENAARAAKSFLGGSAEYVSAVSNLSTVCETLGDKKAALDAAKTAYKALRALSGGGELETEYRERIKRLKSRR
ncbi:MAG: tetratricopeptide repeat protein, partial [Oscillospiraceae bacterium]|nr:tetratricopeptide repeat protein [Oscillospiraceae bacterium]